MLTRRLAEEGSSLCQSKGRSPLEDELVDHLKRMVRKNTTEPILHISERKRLFFSHSPEA